MATGQPGLGASVAGRKGNPTGDEPEEVLQPLLIAAGGTFSNKKVKAVARTTYFMDQL